MSDPKSLAHDKRGASAVEFAIVAPLLILIMFTIVAYGIYFTATLSVEQIAADAARYSVAGLTPGERADLAQRYIDKVTIDDPLIERKNLTVAVKTDPAEPHQFMVSLTYDARMLPIWNLFAFPLPSDRIQRFATIRIGGV